MTHAKVCPPDHPHAATSTCRNNHHCSCKPCRIGRAEYKFWMDRMHAAGKTLSRRTVDAIGAHRRLQALMALGWSRQDFGARLGVTNDAVREWMRNPRIEQDTHDRVVALYEELSMKLPPATTKGERIVVSRSRAYAARNGWPPPLAWDDDKLDEPKAKPARIAIRVESAKVAA